MSKITEVQIRQLAKDSAIPYASLMALIEVEGAGNGFDPKTGKILIQFEPHKFIQYLVEEKIPFTSEKKLMKGKTVYVIHANSVKVTSNSVGESAVEVVNYTIENGVDVQSKEWIAFDKAMMINPNAAIQATSFGMMQVLGRNYKACGYSCAADLYDDFRKGEYQQIQGAINFIKSNPKLYRALQVKDFSNVAFYYNGSGYREFAKKNGTLPYDQKLQKSYLKYT